jgi:hypothetical protein
MRKTGKRRENVEFWDYKCGFGVKKNKFRVPIAKFETLWYNVVLPVDALGEFRE